MSLQGDIARENDVQFFCEKIAGLIKKYPESINVLKELGCEILKILPYFPEWSHEYHKLFRR